MSEAVLESRIPEIIAGYREAMDGVAEAGANLICATAKADAPYDESKGADEPHLRDALHVEKVKDGTHAVVAGDDDVFWGMLVEHGTSHSAPKPFLIPALEADKPEVLALAEAAVRAVS